MGQALLRDRLTRLGVEARVGSAGLISEGAPASDGSMRAMGRRGLDLGAHRSVPLTPGQVATADLLIGMTRQHVREAVVLEPDAIARTFTLRELVRRAEVVGPRLIDGQDGSESVEAWIGRLGLGRRARDLMGDDPADDVADPMGRSRRFYERCAVEIEDLVDRFVALAFPVGGPARADSP